MEQYDNCQRGRKKEGWMNESEGIRQRTCMYNPQTRTTVWWWPEGREQGLGEGGGKGGGIVISEIVSTVKK